LMVFGWPDHRPGIFPALITMPRSASSRPAADQQLPVTPVFRY
jgi:hypothetical protein